jgi:hypothetical protein
MKKYKFITKDNKIIETDNLSNIKEGLTWQKLNNLKPLYQMNKNEIEFIKKYKLSFSIFNIGLLQNLNLIYLFDKDYIRLKKILK